MIPDETTSASALRELVQVRRDVGPVAAVDAADSAGAHEPDPGRAAGGERSADRRCADRGLGDCRGEVARADLARIRGEALELGVQEADAKRSVQDSDRRRNRTRVPHALRRLDPHRHAFARGKPVSDERRLERDDGRATPERLPDLGRNLDHGIAPSRETQREAACAASSGPPTRKPAASASPAPVVSTTSASSAG